MTTVGILAEVLERRRFILWLTVVVTTSLALGRIVQPRTYTASAIVAPVKQSSEVRVESPLGMLMGADDSNTPPLDYLVTLLYSRAVLDSVRARPYSMLDGRTLPLAEVLQISAPDEASRAEDTERTVRNSMTMIADPRTGVVRLRVRTVDPIVAASILEELIDQLRRVLVARHLAEARLAEDFAKRQAEKTKASVEEAEKQLQDFRSQNRTFGPGSAPAVEFARLERELSLRRLLYAERYQDLSQAEMEVARVTAPLIVLDPPRRPARADGRGLLTVMSFGLVLGFTSGVMAVIGLATLRAGRRSSPPGTHTAAVSPLGADGL